MRKYLVLGPNNGSIYIQREKLCSSMPARGRFSGKRVFFGDIILKKRGLAYFGVHSEKLTYQILLLFISALLEYFLDMRKYLVSGPNNGSIYIQREKLCSSMSARGRFSGKRVSLGDII